MTLNYPAPPPATSRVRLLLRAAWVVLGAAALAFVAALGTNVPAGDEWAAVPVLAGAEPAGPWLWEPHDGHCRPLPRLVYYTLFRLTHDFRAGMAAQVALLAGLSLWLMRVAACLRGGPHWADVFFPASLLHLGHWETFLHGSSLDAALLVVLQTVLGVVALRTTPETAFRSGLWGGLLAALLALCGGVVAGLAAAGWLLYLAAGMRRDGSKWRAAVLVLLAALPVAHFFLSADDTSVIEPVTTESLGSVFGAGGRVAFAGVLLLGAATLAVLVRDLRSPAAVGVLAVAVGVVPAARSGLLAWPLLGLAYLVWAKRGGRGGKWVPVALCVAAALAFPANMGRGMAGGANARSALGVIEADIRAGLPAERVAARYFNGSPDAAHAVTLLRASGW